MAIERTLVLVKPDGVKKHLIGEVIRRFELRELKVVVLKMMQAQKETLEKHYFKDEKWL